jgi:hypothetical protein
VSTDPPVVVVETAWTPADLPGQRLALAALLFGKSHPSDRDEQQDQPAA